jgi:hypothetical protein
VSALLFFWEGDDFPALFHGLRFLLQFLFTAAAARIIYRFLLAGDALCGVGYQFQAGDVPNFGYVNGVGGGQSVRSCAQCQELCNQQVWRYHVLFIARLVGTSLP